MKEVALITGASSGIGLELARIHAERGGDLIIVARRKEKLTELKEELEQNNGVSVKAIARDLSKPGAAKALFDQISESGIAVEYLINNAGFGLRGKFHELSWDRQQEMINLNMVSLTELMHLFLPQMVSRNSGKILNTSSTASFLPGPLQALYYASKAYVTYLGNAIAEELYDTNVSITTLMPGATETEFAAVSGMDKTGLFENTVSARSVAEEGYEGMLKGKLDVVSGLTTAQSFMMKSIPFTPKKMLLKQVRKMQEVNS